MITNQTFNHIGTFKKLASDRHQANIPLISLSPGHNLAGNHIVYLDSTHKVLWVVSALCDHANGTLELNPDGRTATCPLHGWTLDLETLQYTNVGVTKQPLNYNVSGDTLSVESNDYHLKFPADQQLPKPSKQSVMVRHLAHACLLFEFDGYRLITDPWLVGPCFANGWWHTPTPADDSLEQLLEADCIYISHNHADHLHVPTLQHLLAYKPDALILVPAFKTQSTLQPLRQLGFTNVHPLSFNQIYQVAQSPLCLSILKSGDFRDDSGLYVHFGEFQGLLTVDSSILNHLVLPQGIDFLATSFASGASGYPWCFETLTIEQRQQISKKRRQAARQSVNEYIDATRPRVFMPYAGYFSELAPRDAFIRTHNLKNTPEDVIQYAQQQFSDLQCINPLQTDTIQFTGQSIQSRSSPYQHRSNWSEAQITTHLDTETVPTQTELNALVNEYFTDCDYQDPLELYLQPCAQDFSPSHQGYRVDFSTMPLRAIDILSFQELKELYSSSADDSKRKLFISVRAAGLFDVLQHRKPWEELSIGFQCRIHRTPDVYNSEFWYYFSNVYIKYTK